MENHQLNWIANFIWGIADDVLRDVYVRGKYRDVIQIRTERSNLFPQLGVATSLSQN
jgi:type I restriction enzyme M protein